MKRLLILIVFFNAIIASAQTFGTSKQTIKIPLKSSPDEKIYNKVTGQLISNEEIRTIINEHTFTHLDREFDKYGNSIRAYYHPDSSHIKIRMRDQDKMIKVGEEFPEFVFKAEEVNNLSSKNLRGSWILLKFDLVTKYLDSLDYEALAAKLPPLMEKYPLTAITCLVDSEKNIETDIGNRYAPILWVGDGDGFRLKYHISRLPTTILIDPEGKVAKYFQYKEEMNLEEVIQAYQK